MSGVFLLLFLKYRDNLAKKETSMLYNPTDTVARRLVIFLQKKGLTTFTFEDARLFDSERRTQFINGLLARLLLFEIISREDETHFRIIQPVEPRKSKKGQGVSKKELETSSRSFLADPEIQERLPVLCQAYEAWYQCNRGVVSSFCPTLQLAQLLRFSSVESLTKFLDRCVGQGMVFTKVGQGYAFLGDFVLYFERLQRKAHQS